MPCGILNFMGARQNNRWKCHNRLHRSAAVYQVKHRAWMALGWFSLYAMFGWCWWRIIIFRILINVFVVISFAKKLSNIKTAFFLKLITAKIQPNLYITLCKEQVIAKHTKWIKTELLAKTQCWPSPTKSVLASLAIL